MAEIRLSYSNIFSALGADTDTVFQALKSERSGLQKFAEWKRLKYPLCASKVDDELLDEQFAATGAKGPKTRLERMLITSLHDVVSRSGITIDARVGLIISTTKGNIDALASDSEFPEERAYLAEMGRQVAEHFGVQSEPIILSNACISGVLAVAIAKRYIESGIYDHVIVTSGDLLTEFVVSGFNSFQALSADPCQPYSADRQGINLGEAAATVLVTNNERYFSPDSIRILGAGSSNDANHISGPSRTGEGLYRSIVSALEWSGLEADGIDLISAHGTATLYNDEMESIAFCRAGLSKKPMHSLKGYFGHCLGSAALLEAIVGVQCVHNDQLITSAGYTSSGVSKPLNVITENRSARLNTFLKTASGFGGCNAAVVFQANN